MASKILLTSVTSQQFGMTHTIMFGMHRERKENLIAVHFVPAEVWKMPRASGSEKKLISCSWNNCFQQGNIRYQHPQPPILGGWAFSLFVTQRSLHSSSCSSSTMWIQGGSNPELRFPRLAQPISRLQNKLELSNLCGQGHGLSPEALGIGWCYLSTQNWLTESYDYEKKQTSLISNRNSVLWRQRPVRYFRICPKLTGSKTWLSIIGKDSWTHNLLSDFFPALVLISF